MYRINPLIVFVFLFISFSFFLSPSIGLDLLSVFIHTFILFQWSNQPWLKSVDKQMITMCISICIMTATRRIWTIITYIHQIFFLTLTLSFFFVFFSFFFPFWTNMRIMKIIMYIPKRKEWVREMNR